MDPKTQAAAVADLEMVIENLSAALAKVLEEIRSPEVAALPDAKRAVVEARLEGGFLALRGALFDELNPMADAWRSGHAFSRKGENLFAESTHG